jgi:hypothetical protein
VDEIRFAKVSRTPGGKRGAVVNLTNGDSLEGQVIELTPEHVVLQTWYAGSLRVRRTMIKQVSFRKTSGRYVYEGPDGLKGWTTVKHSRRSGEQGKPQYKNGALYLIGQNIGIGRNINLPDMAEIQFDVAWKGYLNLQIFVFANKLAMSNLEAFMLNLNNDYVYLQRWMTNRAQNMGNTRHEGLSGKGKATFTLLVDKKGKKIALLIDGALSQQWSDVGDPNKLGKGLALYTYRGGVKISDIRVSAWDGKIEAPVTGAAGKGDTVFLTNNDKVSGTLKAIRDGKLEFQTSYAAMAIPLERVQAIQLGQGGGRPAGLTASGVRATFADGGTVTMSLSRIANGQLMGESENFGKASFTLRAFKSLRLNLKAEREEGEDEFDW